MKVTALILATIVFVAACAPAASVVMQPVESSFIEAVGYDEAKQTLVVQMQNSSDRYTYENVPKSVYEEFMAAESKGRYFVDNIRGKFGSDE